MSKIYVTKCAKNGQVVIPKEIREAWSLDKTGGNIEFVLNADGSVTLRPSKNTLSLLLGMSSHWAHMKKEEGK